MKLVRYNRRPNWPFAVPFSFFDESLPSIFRSPACSGDLGSWSPAVDVSEDQDALTFTAEVPGFEKDGLEISVDKGVLTLSGERHLERKDGQGLRLERASGKFRRSFSLPTGVDTAKITADLKNGLLTIRLAKKEEARPKQIAVTVQ